MSRPHTRPLERKTHKAEVVVVVIKMLQSGRCWIQCLIRGIAAKPSPAQHGERDQRFANKATNLVTGE